MNDSDVHIPRNAMILISLVQGLFLLLLWRAINDEFWPYATPMVNFPLWTMALTFPTFLLFALQAHGVKQLVAKVAGIVGTFAILAVYVGWQASPHGTFMVESLIGTSVATLVLASFCALLLLQASARGTLGEAQGRPWLRALSALTEDYPALFAAAWRNVLVGLLSAFVAGGVALLLTLWGALFRVVGIDFFAELFAKDWFLFPVLSVAFGLGVYIFRSLDSVLGGIVALVEGLMRLLLPLGLAVVVVFLATLPFTGLAPLWETGNGTALLLWLNTLALVFVNGVYQTGATTTYPRLVHVALTPGVALLPIISLLGMYGLYLRVAQYGWSVERCWAALVATVLVLVSLGYSGGVLWRRLEWPRTLKQTNAAFLLGLLALMLLLNTPVLGLPAHRHREPVRTARSGRTDRRRGGFRVRRRAFGAAGAPCDAGLGELCRGGRSAVGGADAGLLVSGRCRRRGVLGCGDGAPGGRCRADRPCAHDRAIRAGAFHRRPPCGAGAGAAQRRRPSGVSVARREREATASLLRCVLLPRSRRLAARRHHQSARI